MTKKSVHCFKLTTTILCLALTLQSCASKDESQDSIVRRTPVTERENIQISTSSACNQYTENNSPPYVLCDSGSAVSQIQQALVDNGFLIDADGYYGQRTQNAVKSYQSSNRLTVTGEVDSSTWDALIYGESSNSPYKSNQEQQSDDEPTYDAPSTPVVTQAKQLVGTLCDLRESGLSSSWKGQSYFWTYYYVWSDGSRTVAKMGQGYDPPYDCL